MPAEAESADILAYDEWKQTLAGARDKKRYEQYLRLLGVTGLLIEARHLLKEISKSCFDLDEFEKPSLLISEIKQRIGGSSPDAACELESITKVILSKVKGLRQADIS
jgi:hypothetical protein